MRVSATFRRFVAWIAVAAMVMGSVAPALAQAWPGAGSGTWLEVCTALGSQWVKADAAERDDSGSRRSVDHAGKHCALCGSHAATLGMPPASMPPLALPALRFGLPERFLTAASTPFAWTAAQPRGPPLLS